MTVRRGSTVYGKFHNKYDNFEQKRRRVPLSIHGTRTVESREESGETASRDACLCERTKAIHVLFALLLKSVFGCLFVHACIDLFFRLISVYS